MSRLIDLTDTTFGELVVLERDTTNSCSHAYWFCRCSCGRIVSIQSSDLRRKTSSVCSVCSTARTGRANKTHGQSRTATYKVWLGMKARCQDPKHVAYEHYGGRGIYVCEAWQTFEGFYADMGERPEGLTLDRIDNDESYVRENCRWTTRKNKREIVETITCLLLMV